MNHKTTFAKDYKAYKWMLQVCTTMESMKELRLCRKALSEEKQLILKKSESERRINLN